MTLNFPHTSGTLALKTDIPDTSKFANLITMNTFTSINVFNGGVSLNAGASAKNFIDVTSNNTKKASYAGDGITLYDNITRVGTLTYPTKDGTIALTSDITKKYMHNIVMQGPCSEGNCYIAFSLISDSNVKLTMSSFSTIVSLAASNFSTFYPGGKCSGYITNSNVQIKGLVQGIWANNATSNALTIDYVVYSSDTWSRKTATITGTGNVDDIVIAV